MKIAIISIGEGISWGAHDELWFNFTQICLKKEHEIYISIKKWDKMPHKIEVLKAQGVTIFEREVKYINLSLTKRIISKIIKKKNIVYKQNPFSSIFKQKIDIVLVNEGAFSDIINFPELYKILLSIQIPYFILSHQCSESGSLMPKFYNLAKKVYTKASKLFFVSQRNIEMAKILLCENLNAEVVKNPINLNSFDQIIYPESSYINLACVARLSCLQKGQDLLLRAFSKLDINLKSKCRLNIYGIGDDELYLNNLCKFVQISDYVTFYGFCDVNQIWKDNHALVLTSHFEGMPLSVVEAMIAGRVTIVTDVGGNTEWVRDYIDGYIINSVNVDSIKAKFEFAIKEFDTWNDKGRLARENALKLISFNPGEQLLDKIILNIQYE